MKKTILILLSVATVSSLLAKDTMVKPSAQEVVSPKTPISLSQDELKVISQNPLFQQKNIKILKGYSYPNIKGFKQLQTEFKTPRGPVKIPAWITPNGEVLVGTMYKDGKPVQLPKDLKMAKGAVAMSYGSGEKGDLYIYTDPECPYCKKLEKEKGKALDGYKVHITLFPLSFHKHAKPMTQWILRGKTDKERADRLKAVFNGSKEWQKDINVTEADLGRGGAYEKELASGKATKFFKDQKELDAFKDYLKRSRDAFDAAGARGTPAIYDKDLKKVNPWAF